MSTQQEIQAREELILGKPPRLPPLEGPEVTEAALALSAKLRRAVHGNDAPAPAVSEIPEMLRTLACHNELWEHLAALSIQLLGNSTLTLRDRELVVLRVLWLRRAPYAWGEHVKQGKQAGMSSEEIERIRVGSMAPGWQEHDRALLGAVEELCSDAMITDKTWEILAKRLDHKQLFELTVLIGQFTTVAYFQNALRLRLAPGNKGLQAR